MNKIKVGDYLNQAFDGFKENWKPITVVSLIFTLIPYALMFGMAFIIINMVEGMELGEKSGLPTIGPNIAMLVLIYAVMIIGILVIAIFMNGFYKMALKIYSGEKAEIKDFFLDSKTYLRLLCCGFMIVLGTFIGCLLCYIPGLIVAFLCIYACLEVISNPDISPWQAIMNSATLAKKYLEASLICYIVSSLIAVLLAYTGFGFILAYPAQFLVITAVYLRIKELEKAESQAQATEPISAPEPENYTEN